MFDMMRELKRTNLLATKEDMNKYQQFLEIIMPEYNKFAKDPVEDKLYWHFAEF